MARSAARQFELFPEKPEEAQAWVDKLLAAFADATIEKGFLPLARKAVAACPGSLAILTLAATAALLDEQPDHALSYLKFLSKRTSAPAAQLLAALVFGRLDQRPTARQILEQNGMTDWPEAIKAFPGGPTRLRWLTSEIDTIFEEPEGKPGANPAEQLRSRSATCRWARRLK